MKETKSEEKGVRESECSIVPMSQGNSPQGDPEEGRGHRIVGAFGGKDARDIEPESVSTGLQRVAYNGCVVQQRHAVSPQYEEPDA